MANPLEMLKGNSGQPGEGLKSLLTLLSGAKSGVPSRQAAPPEQIGAELAYKLAQAAARASDPALLQTSVVELLKAMEGINAALSGGKGPSEQP